MRHWLFHPLVFYPLVLLLAALIVAVSVRPQSWPREPAPVAGEIIDGSIVFRGADFDAPAGGEPQQDMFVARDFWGRAQALRIAHRPGQAPPAPGEEGVRLLLTPEQAAMLEGRPVTIDVSYNPLPVNAASTLAVSLRGQSGSAWVSRPAPPQPATLRFRLQPQAGIRAIGLRAISEGDDQSYGLEITRIRVTPHP